MLEEWSVRRSATIKNDPTIDCTKYVSFLESVGVSFGTVAYFCVPGVQYLKPVWWCEEYCCDTFGVCCILFNLLGI